MSSRTAKPRELFLSHSERDHVFTSWLAAELRAHGVPTWYSATHLKGGQQWQQEIGRALRRCDWFAVVLSPPAVKSMWVERETAFALKERRYRNRIIPVRFKPCRDNRLSWTLGNFQFVDFTGARDAGLAALLKIWRFGAPTDVQP